MIAAAESKLFIDIFERIEPTITASRADASSARGNRNPLKKAEVLNIDFLIAMYNYTANFLYIAIFSRTAGSKTSE